MPLYFAYGSNLLTPRLRARSPSALPMGVASLPGYRFGWQKIGSDRSGKAALIPGRPGGRQAVWGVLFSIHESDLAPLDQAEGEGTEYHRREITVQTIEGPHACFTYFPDPGRIDPSLSPFDWYHALVLTGARQHRLPADWIRLLEDVKTVPDPDRVRASRHFLLLEGLEHGAVHRH
ncbi:MAG: gamma-glutamylcyclotransferase [Puniceicoccaceae bacterium]|nr:MAG: gamma-glutamylcyclotransferase [Puniceicoccaceae bacterium]